MDVACQRLEQRRPFWQKQQETLDGYTTMARISTPEDFLDLFANPGAGLFSPATLNAMQGLSQQLSEQPSARTAPGLIASTHSTVDLLRRTRGAMFDSGYC